MNDIFCFIEIKITAFGGTIFSLTLAKTVQIGSTTSTKHGRYVLAFAELDDIPLTNILAERDLRPDKIKQKVTGCLRTHAGAQRLARIRSLISTARKQSRHVFNEMVNAINRTVFCPSTSS